VLAALPDLGKFALAGDHPINCLHKAMRTKQQRAGPQPSDEE